MSTVSSAASSNAAYYAAQQKLFSKLDSDQNGTLSQDEFVAGRPKDVSEEQASTLYSRIDTAKSNALTEDQLADGMDASSSPAYQISPEVMAILVQLTQQGGMMSSGDDTGGQGGQSPADIYAAIDADGSGSVTQAEFVSARPGDMSEDDAKALYASIDTQNTGSISEEQFADSMKNGGAGGPPPGGPGGAQSSQIYDAMDTNQDGVVSEAEFLAGKPDNVSVEDAQAFYDSIDTEGTGSITEEQFAAIMQGSGPSGGAQSSQEIYDALDTNRDGVVSQDEFLAAKPDDVSTEDATALYKSLDTENTGSISERQLSDFLQASQPQRPMVPPIGMAGSSTDISSLLALLDSAASNTEEAASVLA